MKRNIFIALAATLVLGLAVAVYALNTTSTVDTSAAVSCCCCSGDSCPMKDKTAVAQNDTADKHEGCCCKGDAASCPMKKDGKMAANGEHSCPMMKAGADHKMDGKMEGMKHDSKMAANGEHSCPMMKDGKAHDIKDMKSMDPKTHEMHKNMAATADGKSHSCSCCAHKAATDKL